MSVIFCAHEYNGEPELKERYERIVAETQERDGENTYVSPLSLAAAYDVLAEKDWACRVTELMEICDGVLVIGQPEESVKQAIARAEKLRMPVRYADSIENEDMYR